MQLNVTGHHVEVTASLRGYVEKKLERIGRHFDQVIDVHCVLTVEKLRQKAEATLHVSGSAIHADATEEDMYAAIDLLADKLDRCIKKHKEKRTAHRAAAAAQPRPLRARFAALALATTPPWIPSRPCASSSSAGCPVPARAWPCTCSRTSASTASTTSPPRC